MQLDLLYTYIRIDFLVHIRLGCWAKDTSEIEITIGIAMEACNFSEQECEVL